ncbi:aspartate--tRNA ligase [Hyalangium versicolor]|uniref:aspartate--tRNA ligase n=1 Tax=Hyalangium versicolor TaxID=2861190 RepID=UPI001CCE08D8|nr:aspartate--tRNA ligase [Hyalangium versicolor]
MAVPFITEVKRTHSCGQLTKEHIGQDVVLFGWVQNRRDHGGAVFIDLRDREGLTQVVFEPDAKEAHELAGQLRLEFCIGIRGKVVSRGKNVNAKMKTGEIEIKADALTIFNRSEPTPFLIEDNVETSEEKRLAYRYLDLRRRPLQQSLITRSKMNAMTRAYMVEKGFLELETPFMGKYTPGGARNFLVPSRLNPGKFYALAESPQLYKQLFMVAGFERYFQIVKCFRDEDLRLDRQPEFTQIDVEMSFVTQDDVFTIIEGLIKKLWKEILDIDVPTPFMRMDFYESMAKYGNDKPDLRFGLEHTVLTDLIREHGEGGGVPLMYEAVQHKGIVKAMVIPADKALSRAESDKLEEFAKQAGARGLARAKVGEGGEWTQSPLAKTISPALRQAINQKVNAKTGDLILFQFGRESLVHTVMANLRVHVAKKLGLIPEYGSGGQWKFLWVVNPPLFEYDEESKTWAAAHHAFTRPHDGDVEYLLTDPGRVKCHRYDVVLNGFEIGGGSIRLHDPKVQAEVFKALGISDEEAKTKFGFLLDALKFGAPPHGGIALGMDRLAFLLTGVESLRDVIPFPKTKTGTDQMTGAPGEVDDKQLKEVHVRPVPPPTQK